MYELWKLALSACCNPGAASSKPARPLNQMCPCHCRVGAVGTGGKIGRVVGKHEAHSGQWHGASPSVCSVIRGEAITLGLIEF